MFRPKNIKIEYVPAEGRKVAELRVHAWGDFISFPGVKALQTWLDSHDYRYTWGTVGEWRLV